MGDGRERFLSACRSGNTASVKQQLIDNRALILVQEEGTQRSAVHVAAEEGHTELLEVLLAYGADLGDMDGRLQTPLHVASAAGHLEAVQFLVSRGVESTTDRRGWTALNCAMDAGHTEVVEALLSSIFSDDLDDEAQTVAADASSDEEEEEEEEEDVALEEQQGQEPRLDGGIEELRKLVDGLEDVDTKGVEEDTKDVPMRPRSAKKKKLQAQRQWRETLAGDLATKIGTERSIRGTIAGLDLLEDTPAELTIRTKKQDSRLIEAFNTDAKNGVQQLLRVPDLFGVGDLEEAVLAARSKKITEFFLRYLDQAYEPHLDRKKVGEFLGGAKPLQNRVRDDFIASMDFRLLEFVTAIRHFLHWFQLPPEAQQIDRIMESFAKTFFVQYQPVCPSWSFANYDAVYVLAFATIMLNTDLHNRNVKKKWTKAQFVNSLAEFNDGRNYEQEFLEDLYQTIALDEVAESRFNLAFKRGWLKASVGKAKKRTRWVVLDKSGLYIFKSQPKAKDKPLHHFSLRSINAIYRSATDEKKRIFEVHTADNVTLRFQPRSNIQYRVWLHLLATTTRK